MAIHFAQGSRLLIGNATRQRFSAGRGADDDSMPATEQGVAINRISKYLRAVIEPAFWPALIKGVMPAVEHTAALGFVDAATVIDVGANKGQFSLVVRKLFPDAEIHAFEPIETEIHIFASVVNGRTKQYTIALGSETREATFYVASRLDSSSLLPPRKMQVDQGGVVLSSSTIVPVRRLSEVVDVAKLSTPILMKMDVQGGELEVLRGAESVLPFIDAIYTEVSFVPLYEEQPLASAITRFLLDRGFALRGVFNHYATPSLGPVQADFLFTRAPQINC